MSTDPEIGNKWHSSPDKNHAYLIERVPASQMEDTIEDLMMNLPNSVKQAFFTLPTDNTIDLVRGQKFGYKLPYYNYNKGAIAIKYVNLPDWISYKNDSLY
jgi:hypothetical protein